MRSVVAEFYTGDTRKYEYFVREGDEPKVGDFIVTSIAPGSQGERPINAARIIEVRSSATAKATKFYLYLLPCDVLAERRNSDVERVEKEKRRVAAIQRLRELAEAKALINSLRNETDPEIQSLIKTIEG